MHLDLNCFSNNNDSNKNKKKHQVFVLTKQKQQ